MGVFSVLAAGLGLAGVASAMPTVTPPTNNSLALLPRDLAEQATFCSDNAPATVNAIGQACGGLDGPLVLGGPAVHKWESIGTYEDDPHAVTILIETICDDMPDIGLQNGPPTDESDNCMDILWSMCAASITTGPASGVFLKRGKNDCQKWVISGYKRDDGTFNYEDLKSVDMVVSDPGPGIPVDGSSSPLIRSVDTDTANPDSKKSTSTKRNTAVEPFNANVTTSSASTPNTNTTTLVTRDDTDPSTYCSDNSQALAAAVGQLCANNLHMTPFGTNQNTKSGVNHVEWTEAKSRGPNQAMVQVTNDCPFDVDAKNDCMRISWSLCKASIDNAYLGAEAATGENGCLKWRIPGNGKNNFRWDKMVHVEVDV